MSAQGATGAPVDGRTLWWGKDVAWWRRERIVVLGKEFGSDGPAVIDWLSGEAKLQNAGGWVKSGPHSVGQGCFVAAVTVSHVLSRAVEIGALQSFAERDGVFTCYISGWESDQSRAQAAARQQASRAQKRANDGESAPNAVTVGHGESRSVTKCHVKEEKSREEEKALTPSPSSGVGEQAPIPIDQARDRERLIFDAWLAATARTDHTVFDDKRRSAIRNALKLKQITFDDVLAAARGVRHSEHHMSNKQWSELRVILRDVAQIEHFRDLEHKHAGTNLTVPLAEHPCLDDDQAIADWNRIVAQLPDGLELLLAGSHPHARPADGQLLIGVRPDYAAIVITRNRNPLWLPTALTDGRRVEFLPCPHLQRSAA